MCDRRNHWYRMVTASQLDLSRDQWKAMQR
jgi:hypothetical protein